MKDAYAALAKAQAKMTGAVKGNTNPHFRSTYADLGAVQDACLPALHEAGFAVFQPVVTDETGHWVETVLAHESGDDIRCRVPLLLGKHDMQGLGSAITYARRYGLMCMSGVAPEDDDGNKAAEQGGKFEPRRAPPPPDIEEEVLFELKGAEKIEDPDHLRSWWATLTKARPDIARDERVIRRKDELKAKLMEPAE